MYGILIGMYCVVFAEFGSCFELLIFEISATLESSLVLFPFDFLDSKYNHVNIINLKSLFKLPYLTIK